MNKNTLIGVLGAIIIALVIFLGVHSKKVPAQAPAISQTVTAANQTVPLAIDSVAAFDLANEPVFTGKAFPFIFSYEGTIEGDTQAPGPVGEDRAVQESLGITLAPHGANLNPEIDVFAWKAEGVDPQTADAYCNGEKSSTTLQASDTHIESMTINGYPACYTVTDPGKDRAFIDHSFTLSNADGYFVQFNFREQTNELTQEAAGDIYTQRSYTKFLPEYKAIVESVKIPG